MGSQTCIRIGLYNLVCILLLQADLIAAPNVDQYFQNKHELRLRFDYGCINPSNEQSQCQVKQLQLQFFQKLHSDLSAQIQFTPFAKLNPYFEQWAKNPEHTTRSIPIFSGLQLNWQVSKTLNLGLSEHAGVINPPKDQHLASPIPINTFQLKQLSFFAHMQPSPNFKLSAFLGPGEGNLHESNKVDLYGALKLTMQLFEGLDWHHSASYNSKHSPTGDSCSLKGTQQQSTRLASWAQLTGLWEKARGLQIIMGMNHSRFTHSGTQNPIQSKANYKQCNADIPKKFASQFSKGALTQLSLHGSISQRILDKYFIAIALSRGTLDLNGKISTKIVEEKFESTIGIDIEKGLRLSFTYMKFWNDPLYQAFYPASYQDREGEKQTQLILRAAYLWL